MFVKHVTGCHRDFQDTLNDTLLKLKTQHREMGGDPAVILNISYLADEACLHAFIEWDYGYRDEDEEDF